MNRANDIPLEFRDSYEEGYKFAKDGGWPHDLPEVAMTPEGMANGLAKHLGCLAGLKERFEGAEPGSVPAFFQP